MESFIRTKELLKQKNIEIPKSKDHNKFIKWFTENSFDKLLQGVFDYEKNKYSIVSKLPSEIEYSKERIKNISSFELVVKEDKILESMYYYNNLTTIISSFIDIETNLLHPEITLDSNINHYIIRKSVIGLNKVFEKKIEGRNLFILSLNQTNFSFSGHDIIDALNNESINVTQDEIKQFISHNVVYFDTLLVR
jgi:hypothetical protein